MPNVSSPSTVSELGAATTEDEFSVTVDELAAAADGAERLTALLAEDHPLYDQRGTSAIVRMRGWILLALARTGVTDAALPFVLEELDTGRDGYLVAAAARSLRSYRSPDATLAPFLLRAIGNMRYQDDPVTFDIYGAYATSSTAETTPIRELLRTLAWLGPSASGVRAELADLRQQGSGVSRKLWPEIDRVLAALDVTPSLNETPLVDCCNVLDAWRAAARRARDARTSSEAIRSTVFEDQDGAQISFGDFFVGRPSIVAFFYTRCDNPQKCSLTVSKLAAVQHQLAERGVADRVRTAAITYDPGFDLPSRLRAYGSGRAVRMDADHRLLRSTDSVEPLRRHFALGVNFIESLVNRHRTEVYVLDAGGRVAASFGRIHWSVEDVVDWAVELLDEMATPTTVQERDRDSTTSSQAVLPALATMAAVGVALLPKCPVCWAAYLSVIGVAGLAQVPLAWMQPLLFTVLLVNVACVAWRDRANGRVAGLFLASAGAAAIVGSRVSPALEPAAAFGMFLTLIGSAVSVLQGRQSVLARS